MATITPNKPIGRCLRTKRRRIAAGRIRRFESDTSDFPVTATASVEARLFRPYCALMIRPDNGAVSAEVLDYGRLTRAGTVTFRGVDQNGAGEQNVAWRLRPFGREAREYIQDIDGSWPTEWREAVSVTRQRA